MGVFICPIKSHNGVRIELDFFSMVMFLLPIQDKEVVVEAGGEGPEKRPQIIDPLTVQKAFT